MNYNRIFCITIFAFVALNLCGFKSTKRAKPPVVEDPPTVEVIPPSKPLDLTIPIDKNSLFTNQNQSTPNKAPNFVEKEKNKQQTLQLDGRVLMSQELEAEKRRTMDGAGIVLKVVP